LELIDQNKAFDIIFCSSDRNEEAFNEYYEEMPWKRLVFSDRETKQLLSALFDVQGIPTLVLMNEVEDWLITDGRSALFEVEFDQLRQYEAIKLAEKAKLDEEMQMMPEDVTIDAHPHNLIKMPKVYGGRYGCDICGTGGEGWVYHCDECRYDAHPHCAIPN
jgi:nucleoredoxin